MNCRHPHRKGDPINIFYIVIVPLKAMSKESGTFLENYIMCCFWKEKKNNDNVSETKLYPISINDAFIWNKNKIIPATQMFLLIIAILKFNKKNYFSLNWVAVILTFHAFSILFIAYYIVQRPTSLRRLFFAYFWGFFEKYFSIVNRDNFSSVKLTVTSIILSFHLGDNLDSQADQCAFACFCWFINIYIC